MTRHYAFIFLLATLFACSTTPPKSYFEENPEFLEKNHTIKSDYNFKIKYGRPPFNYFTKLESTGMQGYHWIAFKPEIVDLSKERIDFIESEINKIPAKYFSLLGNRLVYFTIVKNLGSSGITLPVYTDKDQDDPKSIILIDEKIFNRSLCDLISEKEKSVYTDGEYEIKCSTNKSISAFLGLLLHEMSHVVSIYNYMLAHPNYTITSNQQLNWYQYSRISWEWDNKTYVSPKESSVKNWFMGRKYYSTQISEKLPNNQIEKDFNAIKNSSFASFYSVMGPEEDWAELFMLIVFEDDFKTSYKFNLVKKNKIIDTFIPCSAELCKDKRKLMNFFINNPNLFPY